MPGTDCMNSGLSRCIMHGARDPFSILKWSRFEPEGTIPFLMPVAVPFCFCLLRMATQICYTMR